MSELLCLYEEELGSLIIYIINGVAKGAAHCLRIGCLRIGGRISLSTAICHAAVPIFGGHICLNRSRNTEAHPINLGTQARRSRMEAGDRAC